MSAIAITTAALVAAPSVSALVGDRIDPVSPAQGSELPSLVVTLARESDGYTLEGRDEFPEASIIVDARAATYADADALVETVISALGDLRNAALAGRTATFFRNDLAVSDRGEAGDIFRRRVGFVVRWR